MMNDILNSQTPYITVDTLTLELACKEIKKYLFYKNIKQLFPLKTYNFFDSLNLIGSYVQGFSTSSLFELQLGSEIKKNNNQSLHLTSPGLRVDEYSLYRDLADYISFNSLNQWKTYETFRHKKQSYGLRINPGYSIVEDKRYDPCKKHSKLGVPLETVIKTFDTEPELFNDIAGIHFHTNCDSSDFLPLLKTAQHIEKHLGKYLSKLQWINLGGGYLFDEPENIEAFSETVDLFRNKYDLEVFIEPGAGIIRDACDLVSTVIDLFDNGGKTIAILDTTVNHLPEVFEYQYHHEVKGENPKGKHEYILAGSTCLAGDEFGTYRFDTPLEIGSQVTFKGVGAYSLVKAHMFNGINLPAIYSKDLNGNLELLREFGYNDFRSRCIGNKELENTHVNMGALSPNIGNHYETV